MGSEEAGKVVWCSMSSRLLSEGLLQGSKKSVGCSELRGSVDCYSQRQRCRWRLQSGPVMLSVSSTTPPSCQKTHLSGSAGIHLR